MSRIRIDDLPPLEQLTPEELAAIHGAGRAVLGIEPLETRQMMAASVLAGVSGGILRVEGTAGDDKIAVRQVAAKTLDGTGVQVEVLAAGTRVAAFDSSTVKSVEAFGLSGHDTIDLSTLNSLSKTPIGSRVFGGSGNDYLIGSAGNDVLLGGLDNDTLLGNAGNDALYGGAGANYVSGGAGTDHVSQAIKLLASNLPLGDVDLEALPFADRAAFDIKNRFRDAAGNLVVQNDVTGLESRNDLGKLAAALGKELGGGLADVTRALRTNTGASMNQVAGALSFGVGAGFTQVASALWDSRTAFHAINAYAAANDTNIGRDFQRQIAGALANSSLAGASQVAGALWFGVPNISLSNVAFSLYKGTPWGLDVTLVANALWTGIGSYPTPSSGLPTNKLYLARSDYAHALWTGCVENVDFGTHLRNVVLGLMRGTSASLYEAFLALSNAGVGVSYPYLKAIAPALLPEYASQVALLP